MMPATEKMHSGSGSGDPEKTGRPTKSGYGCKTLESGHRFMPNVSTRKLTKAIEDERNPTAKFRLLACRFRKNGYSIRKICRELGSNRIKDSENQIDLLGLASASGTFDSAGVAQRLIRTDRSIICGKPGCSSHGTFRSRREEEGF